MISIQKIRSKTVRNGKETVAVNKQVRRETI